MAKIIFNGVEYDRPADMPDNVRVQYEKAVQMLPDRDRNGVPDLLESDNQLEANPQSRPAPPIPTAQVTRQAAQIQGQLDKSTRWLKVIVIASILGVLACVALAFFGIMSLIKSSEAYQLAVKTAMNHPTVQEILGTPISEGLIASGSVSDSGSSGSASLNIPLSGSTQSGTLYAQVDKENNIWKLIELYLEAGGKEYMLIP